MKKINYTLHMDRHPLLLRPGPATWPVWLELATNGEVGDRGGHGAGRQWHRLESDEPAARGGEESGLGRCRVHGESDLGVEARRISPKKVAPLWHASGGKEPPAAGWRSCGGRQLRARGAAVSSGGGCGGEGDLRGRSEGPVCTVMLSANDMWATAMCPRMRLQRPGHAVKHSVQMTCGPLAPFEFPMIFNLLNFEIQNCDFPNVQNSSNFAG
jgi:hypothetical protein